ncbi:MAG TPA: aminotransferase class I/II-fold pyridoxal phosphate-dependent enzyme [Acidimicrobiales bacterium]|nr:aminotransferase class I/II-fold pyridoxal phosphate-dependent enzyme [Acidimicrobiales bacterium]
MSGPPTSPGPPVGGRRQPWLAARLQGLGTSVFAEMSALAVATGSVNLGQGFPDLDGPVEVAEAAVAAIRAGVNQSPPGPGAPVLRAAVADHRRRWWGQEVDPATEVLVTAGATEALTAAIVALCEVGDEVVTFTPCYDSYPAAAAMAGARLVTVPLRPPHWTFDPDELAAAVTARTRLVVLNSPHNPTGRVFGDAELRAVADVCTGRDVLALTDEVYEHLVFAGRHRPLATLPGMAARTLSVSSAGKTFSFTGWKVGWVVGPADLVAAVRTVKQHLTYVNGAPFQPAVALGLGLPAEVFGAVADRLRDGRDRLCAGLEAAGFVVSVPEAGYFALADGRALGEPDGEALCRALPGRCGVVGIPVSALDPGGEVGRPWVRFAFCKRPEVIDEAVRRLAGLRTR